MIIATSTKPCPIRFVYVPWGVCLCPKSWGEYSIGYTHAGFYISLGFDDNLGSVNAEGDNEDQAVSNAEREALTFLRRQDTTDLSPRQRATRALALSLLADMAS